jgi:uncharacterized protein RhaS with RHS repeats
MRYYDKQVGRYVARDPMGYAVGMNAHVYVRSNPINRVDPLGLGDRDDEPDEGAFIFTFRMAGRWWSETLGLSTPEAERIAEGVGKQTRAAAEGFWEGAQGAARDLERMAKDPEAALNDAKEKAKQLYKQAKEGVEMVSKNPGVVVDAAIEAKDKAVEIAKEMRRQTVEDPEQLAKSSGKLLFETSYAAAKTKAVGATGRALGKGLRKTLEKVAPALTKTAQAGRGKNVAVVRGSRLEARATFDAIRGKAPFGEVKPGVFVSKLKGGGFATYRLKSTSGPPAVEVNKVPGVDYIKIHFVEE